MSYTLLLADDSVTVQRVIELTFADEGFKVVSFSDGDEVVGYLGAGNTPDVILADTTMPARDGYDVAAWVRGQASLAAVPVVLMTAHGSEAVAFGLEQRRQPAAPEVVDAQVAAALPGVAGETRRQRDLDGRAQVVAQGQGIEQGHVTPWPSWGLIAWAASPISTARPRCQSRGTVSR